MTSLPLLLTLSSIIGFIFFIKRKFKISIGILPMFIYSSAIIIGFFSIFLGIFPFFKLFFCLTGNLLLLLEIFFVIKNYKLIKNYLLNNFLGIFFVFLCCGLFFWIKGTMIYGWDEFAWGQLAKTINSTGTFWNSNSAVLTATKPYPPGGPIMQNLFMPFGNFNETALYFANIFPFLCLIIFVINLVIEKKQKFGLKILKILIAFLAILFLYFYFGFNYNFAGYGYIDPTLGIFFTYALIITFLLPTNLKNIYLILPIISLLAILKVTGLLLTLVIAVLVFIRYLIKLKHNKEKITKKWKEILLVFILFILSLSPCFFWNNYIKKEKLKRDTSSITSLKVLNEAFITKNSNRYQKTWNNFYKDIFIRPFNYVGSQGSSPKMLANQGTLINWTIILLITTSLVIFVKKKNKEKIFKDIISYLILFASLFGWILFHLFIWLLVFSEYEGVVLASYERYLSTFLMGISILLFITIIKEIKSVKIISILFFLTIFTFNYFKISFEILLKKPIYSYDFKRNEIIILANKTKKIIEKNNRIYYIRQDSNGYEAMIFRYEMSPDNYVQDWSWSLGNKYREEDVWTVPISIEELKSILLSYDFIVLDKIDENFIKIYGKLFNFSNKLNSVKIWKINKENGFYIDPI